MYFGVYLMPNYELKKLKSVLYIEHTLPKKSLISCSRNESHCREI